MQRTRSYLILLAGAAALVGQQQSPVDKPKPEPLAAAPQLTEIRRVYVDKLGEEDGADHIREMLISSLQNSKLFIITEDQEHADATLKGSAKGETFRETRIHNEGNHAGNTRSRSQSTFSGGASGSRSQSSSSDNSSAGYNESDHTEERKHEASAAVRLVARNGDVIWSTTQESLGAKFRGAGADVADKVSRQLAADWQKAQRVKAGDGH